MLKQALKIVTTFAFTNIKKNGESSSEIGILERKTVLTGEGEGARGRGRLKGTRGRGRLDGEDKCDKGRTSVTGVRRGWRGQVATGMSVAEEETETASYPCTFSLCVTSNTSRKWCVTTTVVDQDANL
jgi:hypothetical protein